MWDFLIEYWLEFFCGIVALALMAMWCYLKKRINKEKIEEESVEKGMRALLHDKLFEGCSFYTKRGWLSYKELKNMQYIYEAYHGLGGNGTGTTAFEDIQKLPKYNIETENKNES